MRNSTITLMAVLLCACAPPGTDAPPAEPLGVVLEDVASCSRLIWCSLTKLALTGLTFGGQEPVSSAIVHKLCPPVEQPALRL